MRDDTRDGDRLTYEVGEAMAKISLGRNAFYKALNEGQIPSIKIGCKILIPRKKFDELFT